MWKYPIRAIGPQEIQTPKNAHCIRADLDQYGDMALWCEVDTEAELETTKIHVVPTGDRIPSNARVYLGSVRERETSIFWHVYAVSDPVAHSHDKEKTLRDLVGALDAPSGNP